MPPRFQVILGFVCLTLLFLISTLLRHPYFQDTSSELYADESWSTPSNRTDNHVLLVSALFPLEKSKHSHDEYSDWVSHYLRSIKTDIYFFTTPDMAPLIAELRGDLPITINTSFSSPYDIPPLEGLKDRYIEMHKIDRENSYHYPELYAIWNGKAYYLDEGLKNAKKTYKYAFWLDAGSFRRRHAYQLWPDYDRLEEIFDEGSRSTGTSKEDLLFIPTFFWPEPSAKIWQEHMGPVDTDFSEGSFMGGSPKAVRWWRQTFYAYHDLYLALNFFVGKDQTLFNSILLLFPEKFITVWLEDPDAPAHKGIKQGPFHGMLGECGGDWYYFEFFLSDAYTRQRMRELLIDEQHEREGKEVEACRLTRLLTMKDILTRRFGLKWTPPTARLRIGGKPLLGRV